MDIAKVTDFLARFTDRHRITFNQLGQTQSHTLELALAVAAAEHYARTGFSVTAINPKGSVFVVKTSTRGHPAHYSRFCISRGEGGSFELHMNLAVRSAHDEGVYCVDLGVVPQGHVPHRKAKQEWVCVENQFLISFAEAKKLVIYPMLIAQFIGIVHEIKPEFLSSPSVDALLAGGHFPPTLVSLGHFSGNSRAIVDALGPRGILIQIIPNFDVELAVLRRGDSRSPFGRYHSSAAYPLPGRAFAEKWDFHRA